MRRLVLLLIAGVAAAQEGGLAEGPLTVGLGEADLGTGHRARPCSEVSLAARGGAVIDGADFYGSIAADALLSGSWAVSRRAELFGTFEFVRWQFVQNATLKGTALGLGQLTLGGSWVAFERGRFVLTPYLRALLPTATDAPHSHTVGGELGAAAALRASPHWQFHGYLGGDLTAGLSAAPADLRAGLIVDAGLQYSPRNWFGLAVDLIGRFGQRAAVDTVAPTVALRFRLWRSLGAELNALVPIVGADRHLAVVAVRTSWQF